MRRAVHAAGLGRAAHHLGAHLGAQRLDAAVHRPVRGVLLGEDRLRPVQVAGLLRRPRRGRRGRRASAATTCRLVAGRRRWRPCGAGACYGLGFTYVRAPPDGHPAAGGRHRAAHRGDAAAGARSRSRRPRSTARRSPGSRIAGDRAARRRRHRARLRPQLPDRRRARARPRPRWSPTSSRWSPWWSASLVLDEPFGVADPRRRRAHRRPASFLVNGPAGCPPPRRLRGGDRAPRRAARRVRRGGGGSAAAVRPGPHRAARPPVPRARAPRCARPGLPHRPADVGPPPAHPAHRGRRHEAPDRARCRSACSRRAGCCCSTDGLTADDLARLEELAGDEVVVAPNPDLPDGAGRGHRLDHQADLRGARRRPLWRSPRTTPASGPGGDQPVEAVQLRSRPGRHPYEHAVCNGCRSGLRTRWCKASPRTEIARQYRCSVSLDDPALVESAGRPVQRRARTHDHRPARTPVRTRHLVFRRR